MPRFRLPILALLPLAFAACAPPVQRPVVPERPARIADTTSAAGVDLPVQGLVRIVQVYGRETLSVGEAENFRLRLAPGFAQPVEYVWDFGDGTRAAGNNVVQRYERPGRYIVTAVVRNAVSADTARLAVVIAPTRRSMRSASAPPLFDAGQIVWVTGIHGSRLAAKRDAARYTEAGHRAGIVAAAKTGTTQYYVIVGGYQTEAEALAARRRVLRVEDRPLWLMQLTAARPGGGRVP